MEKYEIAAVVLKNYGYEDLAKSTDANVRISEIAAAVLENFGHGDIVRGTETPENKEKKEKKMETGKGAAVNLAIKHKGYLEECC